MWDLSHLWILNCQYVEARYQCNSLIASPRKMAKETMDSCSRVPSECMSHHVQLNWGSHCQRSPFLQELLMWTYKFRQLLMWAYNLIFVLFLWRNGNIVFCEVKTSLTHTLKTNQSCDSECSYKRFSSIFQSEQPWSSFSLLQQPAGSKMEALMWGHVINSNQAILKAR